MSATVQAPPSDAAEVISLSGTFGPGSARALLRRVSSDAASDVRRFVVDLTGTSSVAEGPLLLALLSARPALRRVDGRLVVAAPGDLSRRLAANLRLDPVLDAAGSLAEALIAATDEARGPRRAP